MDWMDWLKGKKTVIGGVAGGLTIIAWSLNLIDQETAGMLLGAIATWTTVSLRLAIKKP